MQHCVSQYSTVTTFFRAHTFAFNKEGGTLCFVVVKRTACGVSCVQTFMQSIVSTPPKCSLSVLTQPHDCTRTQYSTVLLTNTSGDALDPTNNHRLHVKRSCLRREIKLESDKDDMILSSVPTTPKIQVTC